jgi:exo-beta-1,3-glucanase (GH17 family)
MWMAGNNDAGNKDQMARGVALANSYPSIVVAVSVGNESLVSWSEHKIPVAELAANIKTVRDQIKQPVTTDDNWAYYAAADRAILDVIDFAAVHTYAMVDTHYLPDPWDWQQLGVTDMTKRAAAMMDAAMVATKADYQAARSSLDKKGLGAMPIVIGETGWMAVNPSNKWYTFLAHPVNQKMYLDRLTAWAAEGKAGAGPKNVFYFEAFDEPWKGDDNGWGLFNVKREARYAIQSLKGNGSALTACTFSTAQLTFIDQANNCKWIWEAGTYTDADALYYKPVVVGAPVTADRYRVYADIAVIGEALPTESPFWVGWGGSAGDTAFTGELTSDITSGDIPTTREIQPAPEVWGWGMIAALQSTAEDLTGFEATGRLNFSIKTSYPGKVEVGFLTGTTTTGSAYDVYLPIDPANNPYGYKNDGAWHQVSIPISAITPKGKMAFGMTDPSKSKLDLTKVTNPFVIADRYDVTGKAAGSGNTDKIYVDAVYWSK